MTNMATPILQEPLLGGHEIYNFGRPFLGHHYNILSFSDLCMGVKRSIFIEIYAWKHNIQEVWMINIHTMKNI